MSRDTVSSAPNKIKYIDEFATSTAASLSILPQGGQTQAAPQTTQIVDAVYGYIQAVRALGKQTINIAEIAQALSLPYHTVINAVQELHDRGIYPIK